MLTVNQMREYTIESLIKAAASMGRSDTFIILETGEEVENLSQYLNNSDLRHASRAMRTADDKDAYIFHISWK